MRERFALVADESGNANEALRVLAGLSGPSKTFTRLERSLRSVLKRHGLQEVKWAGTRTKASRLGAAREFLALAAEEASSGRLGIDLLIFEEALASKSWERLDERQRWVWLYKGLINRAKRRRRGVHWTLYPDQRTGMPWKKLGRVVESSSNRLALVQLADLLAGITRFSRERHKPAAERASARRGELLDGFLTMAENMGLRRKRALVFWQIRTLHGVRRAKTTLRN